MQSSIFRSAWLLGLASALVARQAGGQEPPPGSGPHTSTAGRPPPDGGDDREEEEEYGAVAEIEAPPREVTRRSIRGDELRQVPGTRGDPMRALEVMPSVGRSGIQSGEPILRGASGRESATYLDGMSVPQLFHFGGLTSVVHPNLVERLDVYPGNFSVRFGRVVGGVVDASLRAPRHDGFHGILDLNLVDSSLLLEAPLGKDGGIVLAGRRSNIDLFFDSVVPADAYDVVAAPVYYDYQGIADHRFGRHRLELTALGSSDRLELLLSGAEDADPALRGTVAAEVAFHRVGLELTSRFSDAFEQRLQASFGVTSQTAQFGPLSSHLDTKELGARAEWRAVATPWLTATAGVDFAATFYDGRYNGTRPPQSEGDVGKKESLANKSTVRIDGDTFAIANPAVYAELDVRPVEPWRILPGIRLDHFGQIGVWSADPRLATRYRISDGLTVKAGVGLFTQPPIYWEALEPIGKADLDPQRALQVSAGTEHRLGERVEVGVEGFYKHLFDRIVSTKDGAAPYFENDGTGRIYGADFSVVARPTERTVATLAYTLSRSERSDRGAPMRLFDQDQTHILAVTGSHGFGSGYRVGARFRLISGNPDTPVAGAFFDARTGTYRPLYGVQNSVRTPLFHQLDVRFEKTWSFSKWSLTAYLDLQNAYNAQHEEGKRYAYDFSKSEPVLGLPILPSFGIRGEL